MFKIQISSIELYLITDLNDICVSRVSKSRNLELCIILPKLRTFIILRLKILFSLKELFIRNWSGQHRVDYNVKGKKVSWIKRSFQFNEINVTRNINITSQAKSYILQMNYSNSILLWSMLEMYNIILLKI